MSLLAATLFAQLVIVGGDPAACKAKKQPAPRPEGITTVRRLLELMALNDCVRYLVPPHLLTQQMTFDSSTALAKDWRVPARAKLAALGIKTASENVVIVDGPKPRMEREMEGGIQCHAPGHCTLKRSLVDYILSNTAELALAARIVPSLHESKPDGYRLFAIRPESFWARLGFENGDTMQSFNGLDISTPEKALETYTKLRSADRIAVRIVRRGEPKTFEYEIR